MADVLLADDHGYVLLQPDGTGILAYAYQATGPSLDVLLADENGNVILQPDGSGLLAFSYDQRGPGVPVYTEADYTGALLALLPSGPVWPRDDGATLPAVVSGLAPSFSALDDRAGSLLHDSPTGVLIERLADWEQTIGLPDPVVGIYQTIPQRQQAVLSRIPGSGGQSVPYVTSLAATLGYTVTVQETRPFYCGDELGGFLGGEEWAFAWEVVVGSPTHRIVSSIEIGLFRSALEYAVRRMVPPHTVVQFTYS